MTTRIVDHRERHGVRVELVYTPGVADSWVTPAEDPEQDVWGVQLCSGGDSELEVLRDEWEARAHFRDVCLRALGITVPYQAPALNVAGAELASEGATVFYGYLARLKRCSVGTEQALAIRDEAMADPRFAANLLEIEPLVGAGTDWVSATLRVICKRLRAKLMIAEQKEAEQVYETNSRFGMF